MHTFSSIEKDEYSRLYEFVKSKGLKIGNKQRGAEQTSAGVDDMLDSDQEDDAAPDAYLHRVKREAKARDDNNDDDDEDESDDDFNPDKVGTRRASLHSEGEALIFGIAAYIIYI